MEPRHTGKRRISTGRKILFAFFCCLIVAGGATAFFNLGPLFRLESNRPAPLPPAQETEQPNEEPPPVVEIPEADIPTDSAEETAGMLPVGQLILTKDRQNYEDALLTLHIPTLNLICPVYSGTDTATLGKMGAGLYDYAQLPGPGNRNTSMAGHRNTRRAGVITDKAPFYYVDLLKEGDYLYLSDGESIFRYIWEFTEIVEADDWSMIRTTDYSCVTITSCHPIGISDHRIVVRGRLDEILPFSEDYGYPASVAAI